jgi:DNA polymerase I-like protein with 3'-5' exonuclease and polymerase domains
VEVPEELEIEFDEIESVTSDDSESSEEEPMGYMFEVARNQEEEKGQSPAKEDRKDGMDVVQVQEEKQHQLEPQESIQIEVGDNLLLVHQQGSQETLYATQQPPSDVEQLSFFQEEEISDEALLGLMESYEQRSIRTVSNNLVESTPPCRTTQPPSNYLSPYLQPFTPSKKSTPGRYLYLPPLDHDHDQLQCLAPEPLPSQTYPTGQIPWKHLSNKINCQEFLTKLRRCHCLSFDLVFNGIPISPVGLSPSIVTRAWAPMIALRHSIKGSKKDSHLQSSLAATVLVGISICCGDDVGYFLPLPTIPPLLSSSSSSKSQNQNSRGTHHHEQQTKMVPSLNDLPEPVMILISRYIGFGKILHKCSGLYPSELVTHLFTNESNPLLSLSRKWAEVSRKSLRHEWMRGQCLEWRLLGKIMNSPLITKVSFDMKEKLVSLRERDVIVSGVIEDPKVAATLLEMSDSFQSSLPSTKSPTSLMNLIRESCAVAVNAFKKMNDLERALKQSGQSLWSTFIHIEMPLCYTVADAELNGIPIDTSFFTDLRQDLNDRVKVIEYFFRETQGVNFNISNPRDISRLKAQLGSIQDHVISTNTEEEFDDDIISNTLQTLGDAPEPPHLFLQLVQEWRSHSRLLPVCNLILGSRCRPYGHTVDRTRGRYHTIGTETGRLIISSPPLQQIPHNCSYVPPLRASLHEELQQAKAISQTCLASFIHDLNRKAASGDSEWVRVTKMHTSGVDDMGIYSDNGMKTSHTVTAYTTGKMIAITPTPIDKSLITDRQTNTSTTLEELWRNAGFCYPRLGSNRDVANSGHSNSSSNVVVILININQKVYSYPADQVFRLQASIIPNQSEVSHLKSSLERLSSNRNSSLDPSPLTIPILTSSPSLPSKITINPRDGFRASPGCVFISSDYCQIELRLFAHFALDPKLLQAFQPQQKLSSSSSSSSSLSASSCSSSDPNVDSPTQAADIFLRIASQWKSKSISQITNSERNLVKQLCYALLYGAGPQKIAQDAHVTVTEAQEMINSFLSHYSEIPKLIKEIKQKCYQNCFVETILGRKRSLKQIRSNQRKERGRAERQAVNTVCQGSAADLIKVSFFAVSLFLTLVSVGDDQHPSLSL